MKTVQEYCERKGFIFSRHGEELTGNCPFCSPPDTENKFSINLISGLWQCFHLNRCGIKGNFSDFQKKLGDKPFKLDKDFTEKKKTYKIPEQNYPKMTVDQKGVYDYLKSRGFADETIQFFKLGARENTVIFPYYKNGILVNRKSRNILEKHLMSQDKDAEPTLFNRDNIDSDTIIITEGEYDTMAMHQYGLKTVSVPNGCDGRTWIDEEWDFLETFKRIIICFDNDKAGQKSAVEVANKLGLWRCSIATFPFKDANECLMNGVEAVEIYRCLEGAKVLSPEAVVSPMEFNEKIQYLFEQGTKLFGISTAWDELTDILKGWRGGEVTIWTGRSGSGKSTILNQNLIDLGYKGEKSCIYSGEMSPDRYLRWAIMQFLAKSNPDKKEIEYVLRWMEDKIYTLNVTSGIEPEKLLTNFEYVAKRYGVRHFMIDSLMKVRLDNNDLLNAQKNFVSSLCDFSKKYNVHVNLVVHPRKMMTDKDEPGKVDVKGAGEITDLADNVIVMYRLDDETKEKFRKRGKMEADAFLYVKKNREYGKEGRVPFWFNEQTRLFKTEKGG